MTYDQPGLYMLEKTGKEWMMTAADPTHKLNSVTYTLNGKKYKMELHQNGDLGKSITQQLN